MNEILLDGCRPVPLAGYLKALGVLRLIGEQADPAVRGWWKGDRFCLKTALDRDELMRFFLEDYRPTPIIAPWNAGSGFYYRERKSNTKDQLTGKRLKLGVRDEETAATKILAAIEHSSCDRLSEYRDAISLARSIISKFELQSPPSGEKKDEFISIFRNSASPLLNAWIDTVAVLLPDGAKYPPLLGSGGNDGNLDFSTNLIQRLSQLFDSTTGASSPHSDSLLEGALLQSAIPGLDDGAVGQFAPGAAGGPNSAAGFEGPARVNPWDFVLMLEGALVFAGGVSRKLEGAGAAYLSYPFTVRAAAAGFGTASLEEQAASRGELWAPLWSRPAPFAEVRTLFREGRLSVGARPARDGLDAARAVSALGADRRIAAFERYGFVKRQGLAYLATPLGRREGRSNPEGELLADLDQGRWLDKLRSKAASTEASADLRAAVRNLEDAIFALLERSQDPDAVQAVLIAVGRATRVLALRPKLREGVPPLPPPQLSSSWIERADDQGSPEFRLAVALAGLRGRYLVGENSSEAREEVSDDALNFRIGLPMRSHLGPLDPDVRSGRPQWSAEKGGTLAVWGAGGLIDNLCAVAHRRLIEQGRLGLSEVPFDGAFRVDSGEIAAFLDGSVQDQRIADLLMGLAWVAPGRCSGQRRAAPLPFAYAAIKPMFTPRSVFDRLKREGLDLPMPPALPGLLAAGRIPEAVRVAQERARASGLPAPFLDRRDRQALYRAPDHRAPDPHFGRRLLAALVIPVSSGVVRACLDQAYPSSDQEPQNAD